MEVLTSLSPFISCKARKIGARVTGRFT
jgi:hypothetical protein